MGGDFGFGNSFPALSCYTPASMLAWQAQKWTLNECRFLIYILSHGKHMGISSYPALKKPSFLYQKKPWKSPKKKDPKTWVFKDPSKIKWDLTNGPRFVSCNRAIRYSGFFGVRSLGPVGDFLERMIPWIIRLPILKGQGFFPVDGRSWNPNQHLVDKDRPEAKMIPKPPQKVGFVLCFFLGGTVVIVIYINTKEKRSLF